MVFKRGFLMAISFVGRAIGGRANGILKDGFGKKNKILRLGSIKWVIFRNYIRNYRNDISTFYIFINYI